MSEARLRMTRVPKGADLVLQIEAAAVASGQSRQRACCICGPIDVDARALAILHESLKATGAR
jgi:hypothetical protein